MKMRMWSVENKENSKHVKSKEWFCVVMQASISEKMATESELIHRIIYFNLTLIFVVVHIQYLH